MGRKHLRIVSKNRPSFVSSFSSTYELFNCSIWRCKSTL